MAVRPFSVGVALLGATLALPAHADEFRYVLGHHDEAPVLGGGHDVLRFGDYREAINGYNTASQLHPALTGTYLTYDASFDSGESDWPVFASSWWAQSSNGVARRWNGGSQDYAVRTDTDRLSPSEKYDLLFHADESTRTIAAVSHWNYDELDTPLAERGPKHDHPAVTVMGPVTQWELENHGVYQTGAHPESWWGHCNGWASYVTTEDGGAPERDVRVKLVNDEVTECTANEAGCVLFRMGDIEALMSELYFDDSAAIIGQRCNEAGDEVTLDAYGRPVTSACRDANAGAFHVAITGLLGRGADHLGTGESGRPAFVVDHNWDYEVWNFPVTKYDITETEVITEAKAATLLGAGSDWVFNTAATKFVRVEMTFWMVSDSVPPSEMLKAATQRSVPLDPVHVEYILELDSGNKVLGGEWMPGSEHPDFVWMASDHRGASEMSDDTGGSNDNPYLSYDDVRAILDCANDPGTCNGGTVDPGPGTDPGDEPVVTTPDCSQGCGTRLGGPSPFASIGLGVLGFAMRRRRWTLPALL